jgi:hypothetical protein
VLARAIRVEQPPTKKLKNIIITTVLHNDDSLSDLGTAPKRFALGLIGCCNLDEDCLIISLDRKFERVYVHIFHAYEIQIDLKSI